ncbi:hypothetical protein BaRGS_00033421, partial [Batillaria attramentaria]
ETNVAKISCFSDWLRGTNCASPDQLLAMAEDTTEKRHVADVRKFQSFSRLYLFLKEGLKSSIGKIPMYPRNYETRILERQSRDILESNPKEIPRCLAVPPWSDNTLPSICTCVPRVGPKDSQCSPERKSHTLEHINNQYPKELWTRVYTDGSADDAVRNGGAGVYIQYPGGREEKICLATGLYSSNYKAEAVALKSAAVHIETSAQAPHHVVFLTDALSVLQALQTNKDSELNDLTSTLSSLSRSHAVTLQWIPSHCNLPGNDIADTLAKEGSTKEQEDRSTTYSE